MLFQILLLLLVCLLAVISYYGVFLLRCMFVSKTRGPGFFFVISNLGGVGKHLHEYNKRNNITEPLSHAFLAKDFVIIANDPDSAAFVLKHPDLIKRQFPTTKLQAKEMGQLSLVSANGEDYRLQHQIFKDAFRPTAMSGYFPLTITKTEEAITCIDKLIDSPNPDLHAIIFQYTLDVLGVAMFSHDFGRLHGGSQETYDSYCKILAFQSDPFLSIAPTITEHLTFFQKSKDLNVHLPRLVNTFKQIIADHRNAGLSHGDMLDNMLTACDELNSNPSSEGKSESQRFTHRDLMANFFVFFLAGHETTASALAIAVLCLAEHPDCQAKLRDEIVGKIGNKQPTFDDIDNFVYLDRFIQEVLRMYPPGAFLPFRVAVKDVPYKNQIIPKGAVIAVNHYTVHRSKENYDEPERFNPDRHSPENRKGRHRFALLPFSLGPRECIGKSFSMMEQKLFLTRFIQKFEVSALPGFTIDKAEFKRMLAFSPEAVRVNIKRREKLI